MRNINTNHTKINPSGIIITLLFMFAFFGCSQPDAKKITNPIHSGAFADPSVVHQNDTFYIYATIDPWGGNKLAVLATTDFINFEQKSLNWPTKQACISPTSNNNKVWAPSVIKAPNNKFYMYISIGSEIWAGVSNHPLGPWKNAKADSTPLVKGNLYPEYHMIDAECFIDSDNQAYLYWGSGWNWVNGHCFVVKLNDDMLTFKSEIKDITPPNYFEAPFMLKQNNQYYLMYSDGMCTNRSYKVRYATGDNPFGPFSEGKNSPILSTSQDSTTLGPGHHTVININKQHYIVYHRIKNNNDDLLRELCMDSLNFDNKGNLLKVKNKGIILR